MKSCDDYWFVYCFVELSLPVKCTSGIPGLLELWIPFPPSSYSFNAPRSSFNLDTRTLLLKENCTVVQL